MQVLIQQQFVLIINYDGVEAVVWLLIINKKGPQSCHTLTVCNVDLSNKLKQMTWIKMSVDPSGRQWHVSQDKWKGLI